jgi:hypothetical protein
MHTSIRIASQASVREDQHDGSLKLLRFNVSLSLSHTQLFAHTSAPRTKGEVSASRGKALHEFFMNF